MCRFVPGQAVAVGLMKHLVDLGDGLPGELVVRPLATGEETPRQPDGPVLGAALLKTDPGLEIYAVSKLSARLSFAIGSGDAIVDLNHILPFAASSPDPQLLRLSASAEREATGIRNLLRDALPPGPVPITIGVLDSGLSADYVAHRTVQFLDYTAQGRLTAGAERRDPIGHGTKVVKIFDQILPSHIGLAVGRLPSDGDALTALTVAHALGDMVARVQPSVVNLSVSPRDDQHVCPHCRQRTNVPGFITSMLPLLIRLIAKNAGRTVTVMASGNAGQLPNSRWLTDDINSLIFAVAENQRGERTRYSNAPEGPRGDACSAGAFGGDDEEDDKAQGVFVDGTRGTSFAAPFVAATALLSKTMKITANGEFEEALGLHTRDLIGQARRGTRVKTVRLPE